MTKKFFDIHNLGLIYKLFQLRPGTFLSRQVELGKGKRSGLFYHGVMTKEEKKFSNNLRQEKRVIRRRNSSCKKNCKLSL